MFDAIKRMFKRHSFEDSLDVRFIALDEGLGVSGYYITYPDGEPYAGPYKRERDAKGQLTRMRKEYTPAARRV